MIYIGHVVTCPRTRSAFKIYLKLTLREVVLKIRGSQCGQWRINREVDEDFNLESSIKQKNPHPAAARKLNSPNPPR